MKAFWATALCLSSVAWSAAVWSQGLPPETVAAADAALDQALAKIEATSFGEDVSVSRSAMSRRAVEIPRQGRSLSLQFTPIGGVTLNTSFSKANIGHGPEQQLFKLMTDFSRPLFDACASVGGDTRYMFKGRWLSGEVALQLTEFETLAISRKLSGHHVCEIDGKPAFLFAVTPYGKGSLDFPFKVKTSMIAWAVPARDLNMSLRVVAAEADEFDRKAEEFRATAKPGTAVQVEASALQLDPVMLKAAGPWVCALLIDRKQDLMQVQVGATAVYVPANAVVPKVTEESSRPGMPVACLAAKGGVR